MSVGQESFDKTWKCGGKLKKHIEKLITPD